MIKATEIRIGNNLQEEVRSHIDEFIVSSIDYLSNTACDMDNNITSLDYLDPVPLTEEWLRRLGFEKRRDWQIMLDDISRYLVIIESKDQFYPMLEGAGEMSHETSHFFALNRIDNVHQLQNLYFCLCGKELEIQNS